MPLEIPTNLFTPFFDSLRHALYISWFLGCEGLCILLVSSRSLDTSVSFTLWVFFYFIKEDSLHSEIHILISFLINITQNTLLMST